MVVETIYAGRNNTFSLQLVRGEEPVSLLTVTGYAVHLDDGRVFDDPASFIEKSDGVVEIAIGEGFTDADVGTYRAHLVTYDPINTAGVRWPEFKLRVK